MQEPLVEFKTTLHFEEVEEQCHCQLTAFVFTPMMEDLDEHLTHMMEFQGSNKQLI